MKCHKFFIKPLMAICGLLVILSITSCSDDDHKKVKTNSMIGCFVSPAQMYYVPKDFNLFFTYNPRGATPQESHITGCQITDFNVNVKGIYINYEETPYLYYEAVKKYNDLNAPAELPADAWDYRPLTEPIKSIHLSPDYYDLLPDLVHDEDCSRYFDISYISYYDYIQNGYSWEGIENPGPYYRMSLDEFNSTEPKHLVDARKLTFHIPQEVYKHIIGPNAQSHYSFNIKMELEKGTKINYNCNVVEYQTREELFWIVEWFNTGLMDYFPEWKQIRAPKR